MSSHFANKLTHRQPTDNLHHWSTCRHLISTCRQSPLVFGNLLSTRSWCRRVDRCWQIEVGELTGVGELTLTVSVNWLSTSWQVGLVAGNNVTHLSWYQPLCLWKNDSDQKTIKLNFYVKALRPCSCLHLWANYLLPVSHFSSNCTRSVYCLDCLHVGRKIRSL